MYDKSDSAIKRAFKELLAEMPINRITVIMISRNADITRQTFYYHYSSIAELLKDILRIEIEGRRSSEEEVSSFSGFIRDAIEFMNENDFWLQNIYRTSYQHLLTNSVSAAAKDAAASVIDRTVKNYAMTLSPRDRGFLINTYGAMAVSVLYMFMEEKPENRQEASTMADVARTVFDRSVAPVLCGFDQANVWEEPES